MGATTTLILLNMILYWTQMPFCFTSSPITMNKSKKKNLRMHGQHPAYLSIESFFFSKMHAPWIPQLCLIYNHVPVYTSSVHKLL